MARIPMPRALLPLLVVSGLLASALHAVDRRAVSREGDPVPPPASTLGRAAAWLWSQQQPDGSWRSATYAVLGSGHAYTPFLLFHLLQVPSGESPRPPGGVERALEFLRASVSPLGCLGTGDPDLLEYPVYATSYAIPCLARAGSPEDRELIERMCRWLLSQQYAGARGVTARSPAYGAFGFGESHLPRGEIGHLDLAHTRRALQALRAAGALDAAAGGPAVQFLALLQKLPRSAPRAPQAGDPADAAPPPRFDGGFYFSPTVLRANKGRLEPATKAHAETFQSYATATADGLLALLAAGVLPDDERVQAAAAWLARHPALQRPAGIPVDNPEPWYDALHYYHLAVRAEVFRALGQPASPELTRLLEAQQQASGCFQNQRSSLMKEDDPLLATGLAVAALVAGDRRR